MRIHILGIAGTMTAPLAVALKKQGHIVTGSDQEKIYPPFNILLKKAKISVNSIDINKKIDFNIIGSSYKSFHQTQKDFEQIKHLHLPFISATKYISQYIAKPNSIIIAGSFGKTTITSLIAWIFSKTKINPSYMFAGNPINKFDPIHFSPSDWSILEGDESINGLDKMAKFLYYPCKYLLLTSAQWEHKDSYPKAIDNFNAFKKLILNVPQDGIVIINSQDYQAKDLSIYAKSKVVTYNSPSSNYFIDKYQIKNGFTTLVINTPNGLIPINTRLIGQFNFENILAAVTLCDQLKINRHLIQKAIFSFRGIKRRLELVGNYEKILFFDDFAQSAPRINSTIKAIQLHYPNQPIKIFFQAHASFLQHKSSLIELKKVFQPASEIILGPLKYTQNLKTQDRLTVKDFKSKIGKKLIYLPLEKQIIDHYIHHLHPNDIFIYMSSGGLSGSNILKSIIKRFK